MSPLSLSRLRFTSSKLQSCQSVPHRLEIDCGTFMLQGVANTPLYPDKGHAVLRWTQVFKHKHKDSSNIEKDAGNASLASL